METRPIYRGRADRCRNSRGARGAAGLAHDLAVTSRRLRAARLALAGYLGLVLALTLAPAPGGPHPLNLVPTAGIQKTYIDRGAAFGTAQVVGNLLLLAPAAILLRASYPGTRLRHVLVGAVLLSAGIELVQWQVTVGRAADIDDVWLNTLGAALGYLAADRVR